ncbi:hypothetical protein GCM10023189_23180 [Nibrella saemangeumensis]|uniref:GP-PDE domain-containing protein n=1 Tax=Nibrella saemangeumensis TaxID=1084526 RepID=A0ABP8MVC2_9BACT
MKKLLLFFLLAATACAPKTQIKVPDGGFQDYFKPQPGQALISAHRGGGDYRGYPENSIESFAYLAEKIGTPTRPIIIECDINLTRDSVLMMMHDDKLDRTSTGTGRISDVTWDYCKTLRLEDNQGNLTRYKIPTLEQVLRWGKGRVLYTLDVKRSVPFDKVVAMIHRTNAADYAAVITYNAIDAAKVYRLDPSLMISVNVRNRADYERLRELGVSDRNMIAFIGTREADPELYRFLHDKGIACILGTLGNLDKQAVAKGDYVYREFVRNGADILSTDRPLEVLKAVEL